MKFLYFCLFLLLPLNVEGVDPADYLAPVLASLAIVINPKLLLLEHIPQGQKILIFFFLISFLISSMMGLETRFFVFIITNFTIFILIYHIFFYKNPPFPIFFWLSFTFTILNTLFFIAAWFGFSSTLTFNFFRNGRFLGTFGDPNFTGFCAVISVVYFLERILQTKDRNSKRLFDALLLTLSVVILLLSESRAAWGCAAVALISYLALYRGRRLTFIFPILLLVMAGQLTLLIGDLLGNEQVGSFNERLQTLFAATSSAETERFQFLYTREALNVGLKNPLGIGPGMTSSYTGITSADGLAIGSHNSFVQIFTELGWLAFFSLILIYLFTIARLFPLALQGKKFNDVSCKAIFSLMMGQTVFAMAHDMIAWRIGWFVPTLAICVAFAHRASVGRLAGRMLPRQRHVGAHLREGIPVGPAR